MGVRIDDLRRHELAGAVDLQRSRRRGEIGPADRLDHAVGKDDRAVVDLLAVAGENRRMPDDRQDARVADVG